MFNHSAIPHSCSQRSAFHGKEEQVDGGRSCESVMDDELNTKSMMTTPRGEKGEHAGGAEEWGVAVQAEVLTVRAACQSSHQRRVSEGDLAERVGRA